MKILKLLKHDHQWRQIASTGRDVRYSDTAGTCWVKKEVIYQCRKCKDIMVTTEVPKKTYL